MTTVTILPTTQPMTRAGATVRVIRGLDGSRRRPGAAPESREVRSLVRTGPARVSTHGTR